MFVIDHFMLNIGISLQMWLNNIENKRMLENVTQFNWIKIMMYKYSTKPV